MNLRALNAGARARTSNVRARASGMHTFHKGASDHGPMTRARSPVPVTRRAKLPTRTTNAPAHGQGVRMQRPNRWFRGRLAELNAKTRRR
jgi:hypothetical protein